MHESTLPFLQAEIEYRTARLKARVPVAGAGTASPGYDGGPGPRDTHR